MTTNPDDLNFDEVDVPQGQFFGWGDKPGQVLTLDVISYSPTGGTDFNEQECPAITGVALADTITYKDKGTEREKIEKGSVVQLNCGQANLKRTVLAANPSSGDVIRISFVDTEKGAKGQIKLFKAEMARGQGSGRPAEVKASSSAAADDDDF